MEDLKSKIESLLFVSAQPMSVKQLAGLLKKKEDEVKKAGEVLVEEYRNNKKGVQIIKNASKFQMVSSPENSQIIQEFIKDETTGELSRASLETLTIIAYKSPISRVDLDRIRGVNCAQIVRNLLMRGLIEAKTNKDKDETFYSVTFDFIRFLGINDVKELPDYEKLRKDDRANIPEKIDEEEKGSKEQESDVAEEEKKQEVVAEESVKGVTEDLSAEALAQEDNKDKK